MEMKIRGPKLRARKNEKDPDKRWQPCTWQPEYEEIVSYSCRGISNKYLAEKFNLHVVQISNILNCTEALELKRQYIEHARNESFALASERLKSVQETAMNNVVNVLGNQELLVNSPFSMFDRSMAFMKATGIVEKDTPTQNTTVVNQTTNVIQNNLVQLADSLKLAEEARKKHFDITGVSIN